MSSVTRIGTPCIGVCSTVFGDTVCRGCRRFSHEVVDWNSYSDEQKQLVWQRLDQLLGLVVSNYFTVCDPQRLADQLRYQNVRMQPQLSAPGWVPELLKAAGSQNLHYPDFGLLPLEESKGKTPRQLYLQITQECHTLARAHYDRSFARPVTLVAELAEQAAREKGLN